MRADWDVSSESADEAELRRAEQAEAGERFMEVMIQGYADMKIDAKLLCVACHWAAKAGAVGEAARYGAISPDQSSDGHYQAHLDRFVPARPESLEYYPIEAPCRTKEGVARAPTTIHTVPPPPMNH